MSLSNTGKLRQDRLTVTGKRVLILIFLLNCTLFRTDFFKPEVYLPTIIIVPWSVLHAVARSVASELYRHRRPKVVATDGFVDEDCEDRGVHRVVGARKSIGIDSGGGEEEETLDFNRDGTNDLRLRSSSYSYTRKQGDVKRSPRENLCVPMATPALETEKSFSSG